LLIGRPFLVDDSKPESLIARTFVFEVWLELVTAPVRRVRKSEARLDPARELRRVFAPFEEAERWCFRRSCSSTAARPTDRPGDRGTSSVTHHHG